MTQSHERTRKMIILGIMSAVTVVITYLIRLPIVSVEYLKFTPSDVIVALVGLIYGPLSAFVVSFISAFIEMLTFSSSGPIGFIMNVLGTSAFACTGAFIYKRMRNIKGAVIGLVSGVILMTVIMMLWNYLVTPFYNGTPRDVIQGMLLPIFMPFNLIKGGINAAVTLLLYKPVVGALRTAKLIPASKAGTEPSAKRVNVGVVLVAVVVLATCILAALVMRGVI